jgi:hypothetical protein
MDEIMYGMGDVSEFLGISRQQAYNRKQAENWEGCVDGDNGRLLVPSTIIRQSRDLEKQKLLERVGELERYAARHNLADAVRMAQQGVT